MMKMKLEERQMDQGKHKSFQLTAKTQRHVMIIIVSYSRVEIPLHTAYHTRLKQQITQKRDAHVQASQNARKIRLGHMI